MLTWTGTQGESWKEANMRCVRCNKLVVETTTGYAHRDAGEIHAPEMKVVELTGNAPHPPPHSPSVDTLDFFEFPGHYSVYALQIRDFLRMYYFLPGFDFKAVREHDTRLHGHCCAVCAERCHICAARGVNPHQITLKSIVSKACWELVRREPNLVYSSPTQFITRVAQMVDYSYKEVEPYVNEWKDQR